MIAGIKEDVEVIKDDITVIKTELSAHSGKISSLTENIETIKGILIHELIHVLLKDNKKILDLIRKKFNYEDYDFKVHFPVLLIQRKVIENLYGKSYFLKVLQQEKDIDELGYEWDRVNQHYNKFDKGIVNFLQNAVK